ncbi:MAG: hypothetical protein IJT45_02195 [Bacteroidales bacterium]|nr:hypothetical protein [Muribaculaceae bacterium]MBQ7532494.1 hypothetical protein [Bacteroidales bacterium]
MKKCLLSMIALLACVTFLSSCEDDIAKRQAVFTAIMPADDLSSSRPGSIINGIPDADGFNLNAQWKEGDKIQIFVRQDGRVYQVENPAVVSGISSDGKSCSFELVLPKSVKTDRDYDIIGVTGVEAYIDGEDVIASCELKRVGVDDSDAPLLPMWFTAKKGSNQAKFRHLCAYEVLTVSNNSETSIRFKHEGFEVMTPWYKYSDKVVLTGKGFSGHEAGQTDAESNEITIPAGETGTIVSWYIPRFDVTDETPGGTINNARLKTVINGSTVTTVDAMKAYKNFARGNAYYMGADWDGATLSFSNEFCPDGNHPHAIDLGLPSGTKWACCNVGANSPAECGDYFAWGETSPKTAYLTSNYKWYRGGDPHNISKYCHNSDYGTVDNRTELELEDDAAYVNWGPQWHMPSRDQSVELLDNCTSEWTTVNGMSGYLFKSKISNSAVFFPALGYYTMKGLIGLETDGVYWLNSYNFYNNNYGPVRALGLGFRYGEMGWLDVIIQSRQCGSGVRPVHVAQE